MRKLPLLIFGLALLITTITLAANRPADPDPWMLVQRGSPGREWLELYDPASSTALRLTDNHTGITLLNQPGEEWVYFAADTGPRPNQSRAHELYRLERESGKTTLLADDLYPARFPLLNWAADYGWLVYVDLDGKLVRLAADGSQRRIISPPEVVASTDTLWSAVQVVFGEEWVAYSGNAGGNSSPTDVYLVRVDGSQAQNLTTELAEGLSCQPATTPVPQPDFIFIQCGSAAYYRRKEGSQLYPLGPPLSETSSFLPGPSYVLVAEESATLSLAGAPFTYQIDLSAAEDPLPYAVMEQNPAVQAVPIVAAGEDWQIEQRLAGGKTELVRVSEQEERVLATQPVEMRPVVVMPVRRLAYFDSTGPSQSIIMYAVSADGQQLTELYRTDRPIQYVTLGPEEEWVYFGESQTVDRRYKLKRVNLAGEVQTAGEWRATHRFISWQALPENDWQPGVWAVLGGLLAGGMLLMMAREGWLGHREG